MTINNLTAFVDIDAQNMYKQLADDIIQAVGTDFYYLPKERLDVDAFLREDIHRVFKNAYIIEGYVKNKEQYVHTINAQAKYGMDYREYITLCITKNRFHQVLPIEFARPRTGDLIYSPVYKGVFTINYTEHEMPFYQLQQLTFYELYLERYVYNQDTIETGIAVVDNIQYEYGYQITIQYTDRVGTFVVGDKVDQTWSGITIRGKIASIDTVNNRMTITDITSNNELQLNFVVSETYLVYKSTDNTRRFEISKIYDVNSTLATNETDLVIPNSDQAQNQELEKDIKDYINPVPSNNPFWS
jgi:hypothetical protein